VSSLNWAVRPYGTGTDSAPTTHQVTHCANNSQRHEANCASHLVELRGIEPLTPPCHGQAQRDKV